LRGEEVTYTGETISLAGARLEVTPPSDQIPLYLGVTGPSSLSERTLLEGDKGRQNNNFNKNVSQMGASEPNCRPPQSPFGAGCLPVWARGARRGSQLALADQQGMQPFQVEANADQVPFTGGLE
jgi:hypothetical protein